MRLPQNKALAGVGKPIKDVVCLVSILNLASLKAEKAAKALKLFDTQKAAIAYAETIAENQDGNFVIHKKDGKIRKQDYSK